MDIKDKNKIENPEKRDKDKGGIWIDVHSDLVAGIKAFSQCLTLCDVMGDGDHRLICGDSNYIDPSPKEAQIWSDIKDNKIDYKEAFSKLEELVKNSIF